jgi:glutamate synthase (NADPH) small chain
MAERMLKFVTLDHHGPAKRASAERKGDFHEVYGEFIAEKASQQASRCSQCGVPFCQSGCPLQNNIPDWLKLTAEGRLQEAYEVSAATNAMPEICGRICPQDRLCEAECVIEQFSGHGTVTIGAVEKYLTETAFENGWVAPVAPPRERHESVGVIGAGPAGLAAAETLRGRGYQVTVYDRHDRPGGLLIYGIPNFKLEKPVVERRSKRLADGGVKFVMNCDVGVDIAFEDLRARHDAVLVATGVYKARPLNAPNAGEKHLVKALDYLIASNRAGLGDAVPEIENGNLHAKGRRVVVIGGGDTAMDCVRTAVRQGAKSVTCLYRRDRANMPGSQREVGNAEEEGVLFDWLAAPKAIKGGAAKSSGVKAVRMRLGAPDASGRQAPEEAPDSEYNVPGDLIIAALGFDPEDLPEAWSAPELKTTRWGTVRVDHKSMGASLPGVFAAGDIVRGASLVVWAIREGRDAADSIHAYLRERAGAARVAAE